MTRYAAASIFHSTVFAHPHELRRPRPGDARSAPTALRTAATQLYFYWRNGNLSLKEGKAI